MISVAGSRSPVGPGPPGNSYGYSHPTPTPKWARPPVTRSRSAICFATAPAVERKRRIKLPTTTRSVTAADASGDDRLGATVTRCDLTADPERVDGPGFKIARLPLDPRL